MKTTKRLNDVIPNWSIGEGIFSALNGFAVPWQYEGIASELDLEYHGNISGEKKIFVIMPFSEKTGKYSKGFFNVPFSKKEKVNTFDDANFNSIRQYFLSNNINITSTDYHKVVEKAKAGDFVYFDPPYDVYPDKLGFVDYGKDGFGKEEQIKLRDCFKALSDKGVKVMLSNHNTPFINELYKGFNIHVINAKRMINSKADGRGNVQEVIITNY